MCLPYICLLYKHVFMYFSFIKYNTNHDRNNSNIIHNTVLSFFLKEKIYRLLQLFGSVMVYTPPPPPVREEWRNAWYPDISGGCPPTDIDILISNPTGICHKYHHIYQGRLEVVVLLRGLAKGCSKGLCNKYHHIYQGRIAIVKLLRGPAHCTGV